MPDDLKLPATAYVVLGLASIRPTTGHELAAFSERSIGNFFPIARSQVYSELERLCRKRFLSVVEVPQPPRPTRRVYEVTESGDAELRRWLVKTPVEADRTRNLFLVRVFFGDLVSPEQLDRLLDEYEANARAHQQALSAVVDKLAERPGREFRQATALFGMRHAQATLEWVADVRLILREPADAALSDRRHPAPGGC